MFEPLFVAATGLDGLQDEMTAITDNIANSQTTAFKRSRVEMESLFYTQRPFADYYSAALQQSYGFNENSSMSDLATQNLPIEFGTGMRISATTKDFAEGQMQTSNNPLDLAIKGEGFFKVRMQDGTFAYTRAGNFHKDNDGNLVTQNGNIVEPSIVFPEDTVTIVINSDGTVLTASESATQMNEIGQIPVVRFRNPAGLESMGQNLFKETPASGDAVEGTANESGFGAISQYTIESSNVDIISELTKMMMTQRVFDTVTKAVQSYEAMLTSLQQMKQA